MGVPHCNRSVALGRKHWQRQHYRKPHVCARKLGVLQLSLCNDVCAGWLRLDPRISARGTTRALTLMLRAAGLWLHAPWLCSVRTRVRSLQSSLNSCAYPHL
jgi:hypothetical protein